MTGGKGGEVGSHPDFRRGGGQAGVFLPVGGEAGRLLQIGNLRQGKELAELRPCLIIVNGWTVVKLVQTGGGDQAQERLLGGTTEGDGTGRIGPIKNLTCHKMSRMLGEGKGQPETGVNEAGCGIQGLAG